MLFRETLIAPGLCCRTSHVRVGAASLAAWCLLACPSPLTADKSGASALLRCRHDRRKVLAVSPEQWRAVRAMLLSHDSQKIAPLVSDRKGIYCTSLWVDYDGTTRAGTYHQSKAGFLQSLNKGEYQERGTFTGGPDRVYAFLWVSLKEDLRERSVGKGTWIIERRNNAKYSETARIVFFCEQGTLRIKSICSYVSGD